MRCDAQRNRDTLLEAAGTLFAEQGLQAPLEHAAKRAGVAIGTLYRHFPTRLDLVEALFTAKLRTWYEAAEQALAMEDAWEGFVLFVETMCELQADDRDFNDLAAMRVPISACLDGVHSHIYQLGALIMQRAQEQGSLRADVTAQDLPVLIWSQSRVTQATSGIATGAWRRHLYLMLDAYRAERARHLPEPPMTPGQVDDVMDRLGRTR